MARKDAFGLLVFLAVCLGLGITRLFSALHHRANWFATVARPDFTLPPDMVGPFWTLLYVMTALAGWLVWREVSFTEPRAAIAYIVQLACNLFSALFFFDAQHIGLLLTSAVLLTLAIIWNIWEFWRIERVAAILLVPYLVWMGFASLVNVAIWRMN